MHLRMKCPRCGKRAFDISRLPNETLIIELKCPRCNNLVKVKCDKTAILK